MVDISNMGDDSLEKICKDIEKKKIQVLVTYSSALTALTGYIRRTGRDISKWKVEMVFSMGEALPDATYELTKEIFGYSPVRSYGNNENGFIAIQLGEDREYTIDLYNFYPEVLKMNSDEPAELQIIITKPSRWCVTTPEIRELCDCIRMKKGGCMENMWKSTAAAVL